ncbi:MAG: chloride channel protein [Desulfosalsimonadaceae bacterium]
MSRLLNLNFWRYPSQWILFRLDDRLLLIIIGALVGICSGLAAVAMYKGLVAMFALMSYSRGNWWAFLLPGFGAAGAAVFLEKFLREGAGHGVPEVVYSVSRYGGLMRFRSSFSRLISGCLTIGSGGSAGPESPVVMSGAAIGSNIAQFFSLNDRQRVAIVGCGSAGALAAIFNAPIAGLVFTIEVIVGEWSAVNIVPIAIASVSGAEVCRLLMGHPFGMESIAFQVDLVDTLACVGLAVFTAASSVLLTRGIRWCNRFSTALSRKGRLPFWVRPLLGGFAVGLIGLALPQVLGEGYHYIREMVSGNFAQGFLLALVLVLAKIAATSLTLGSGGSGGIFAPCLVLGSFTGLVYHRLIDFIGPGLSLVDEGCFALLGMAGLVSGILQAPLTGIFLIVEITGGYGVILPLIVVSAVSATVTHAFEPASFYLKELVEKGHYLRPRTDERVLADLTVRELVEKDCIVVYKNMKLGDFVRIVQKSHRNFFPVEDEETGYFAGMIHLDDIREYLFDPLLYETVFLEQIMDTEVETVDLDDDLTEVLERMDSKNLFSLPVVVNNRFIGMISKATLLDKYRSELMVQSYY